MNRRQELLHEQMQIYENHCKECPYDESEYRSSHCLGCEQYMRLRKIGNDLLSVTKEERKSKGLVEEPKEKPNWKITVKQYRYYKRLGWSDEKVAKKRKISTAKLVEFKRAHGLTK